MTQREIQAFQKNYGLSLDGFSVDVLLVIDLTYRQVWNERRQQDEEKASEGKET